jgi:hypothetical protein
LYIKNGFVKKTSFFKERAEKMRIKQIERPEKLQSKRESDSLDSNISVNCNEDDLYTLLVGDHQNWTTTKPGRPQKCLIYFFP